MKVFLSLTLLLWSGFLVAQDITLIEKLAKTQVVANAADGGKAHFVLFSGSEREMYSMPDPALNHRAGADFERDMRELFLRDFAKAMYNQRSENPNIVVIIHKDMLPSHYEGKSTQVALDLQMAMARTLNTAGGMDNVELIVHEDKTASGDKTRSGLHPIIESLHYLESTCSEATFSHHLMQAGPKTLEMAAKIGLATGVLTMGSRSRLNIRFANGSVGIAQAIPAYLMAMGPLFPQDMKVEITRGSFFWSDGSTRNSALNRLEIKTLEDFAKTKTAGLHAPASGITLQEMTTRLADPYGEAEGVNERGKESFAQLQKSQGSIADAITRAKRALREANLNLTKETSQSGLTDRTTAQWKEIVAALEKHLARAQWEADTLQSLRTADVKIHAGHELLALERVMMEVPPELARASSVPLIGFDKIGKRISALRERAVVKPYEQTIRIKR